MAWKDLELLASLVGAAKSTAALLPLVAFGVTSVAAEIAPPAYPGQAEGDFVVRDFKFQNGETLPELKLHYMTLGTPRKDAAGRIVNAVLLLHGTSSSGKTFLSPSFAGQLFGSGQPLDAAKYYLVLPDGIGRGGSSKPSDGLKAKFPRYGYNDVVEGQYRLVKEGLGIDHLKLVLGTSMGGMQSWIWGERYSDMMDAIVPIASQPVEISGRNLLWRRLVSEAIRNDPEWRGGDYTTQPRNFSRLLPIVYLMAESPVRMQEIAPTRAKANDLYDQLVANYAKTVDANDYLYWFESSYDYNPSPDLEKITAKVMAINFADDEINPPELGIMEKQIARMKEAKLVMIPASAGSHGHASLIQAALWKSYLAEFLASLE